MYNNIEFVNNKIHISKNLPNLRLHYFNFPSSIPYVLDFFFQDSSILYNLRYSNNYNYIKTILDNIKTKFQASIEYIKGDQNIYINKLRNNYSHPDIKKIIIKLYDIYVINLSNKVVDLIDQTITYINNTPKLLDKYTSQKELYELHTIIFCNISIIELFISMIYPNITDIFLIRRLLDKDYIKNCIIYTGGYHMINIAYYLVKYFDFTITCIAHSDTDLDNGSIKKVNTIIKEHSLDNFNDIRFLETYLYNDYFQCSNLFNFPDNLL